MMVRRELYLKRIEMYIGRPVIKLITGVRRSGKTTLLRQIRDELQENDTSKENTVYINFDGLNYAYLTEEKELYELLRSEAEKREGKLWFFLDELQNVKLWAKAVTAISSEYECEFFITSSTNKLLYDGFAGDLGYRYVKIDVYPLTFSEYLEFVKDKEESKDKTVEELFKSYLLNGAMPGVHSLNETIGTRKAYLQDIYNSILLKDVVQCNKLRDISHIDRIMQFIMENIGNTFSPKAIKDYVKEQGVTIIVDTVYSFLDALMGAYLIYRVPRYDIKNDKLLETQEKYYVCDFGMKNAVMGKLPVNYEAELENVLFLELLARGFKVYVGKQGRYQIDFMGTKQEDRTYINCCSVLPDNEAVRREFNPLIKIKDNYFKIVLSMDSSARINKGGIINYPLLQFLCEA